MDATQAIENPELLAAIDGYARDASEDNRSRLSRELARATYLVPVLLDEGAFRPGAQPGEEVVAAGSGFQTYVCHDPSNGKELLPIFSDPQQLASFTRDKVSTLVMQLREVHELLSSANGYAGAVVNPAGTAIPISRRMLAELSAAGAPD